MNKKRDYSPEVVKEQQGSVQIEHTLAKNGSLKLRKLFAEHPYIITFGAYNVQQAV